ncbi:hypothetical protein RSAG8_00418, partial [Rhizoctonia solani AG-8 WAC10335]
MHFVTIPGYYNKQMRGNTTQAITSIKRRQLGCHALGRIFVKM